jgi:hypothetical protein
MTPNCNFNPQACLELTDARIELGKTETRLTGLEIWKAGLNGRLDRIDARIEKLLWFLIVTLATSAGTLLLVVLGFLKK